MLALKTCLGIYTSTEIFSLSLPLCTPPLVSFEKKKKKTLCTSQCISEFLAIIILDSTFLRKSVVVASYKNIPEVCNWKEQWIQEVIHMDFIDFSSIIKLLLSTLNEHHTLSWGRQTASNKPSMRPAFSGNSLFRL